MNGRHQLRRRRDGWLRLVLRRQDCGADQRAKNEVVNAHRECLLLPYSKSEASPSASVCTNSWRKYDSGSGTDAPIRCS